MCKDLCCCLPQTQCLSLEPDPYKWPEDDEQMKRMDQPLNRQTSAFKKGNAGSTQKGLLTEAEQGRGPIMQSLDRNQKAVGKSVNCLSTEMTQPNLGFRKVPLTWAGWTSPVIEYVSAVNSS